MLSTSRFGVGERFEVVLPTRPQIVSWRESVLQFDSIFVRSVRCRDIHLIWKFVHSSTSNARRYARAGLAARARRAFSPRLHFCSAHVPLRRETVR